MYWLAPNSSRGIRHIRAIPRSARSKSRGTDWSVSDCAPAVEFINPLTIARYRKMKTTPVITSPNLDFPWLTHGFGLRDGLCPIPPGELTTAKQIHSARVLDAAGRKGEQIGEGDAIVSADAGVAAGIRTADCVPILLADSETRIVACVHAGWRGTAANIIRVTVEAMQSRGCQPENLHVAIGPSIGSCCYEVGAEVARHFETWRKAVGSG